MIEGSKDGLFETMRWDKGRILYFDWHLKRIKDSSKIIGIDFPCSLAKLKKDILKEIKLSGLSCASVKVVLLKNETASEISSYVKKYTPWPKEKYAQGFSASISDFRQNENNPLAQIKTTNRVFYELAYKKAKDNGFDEAIILNSRGLLCELTRANIFFVSQGKIFTPSLECGCLNGITRRVILDLAKIHKLEVNEGKFTLSDLRKAQEAFLTNSLIRIMPLTSVGDKLIGCAIQGKLTKFFIEKYKVLIK